MLSRISTNIIDLTAFLVANAANLALVIIFLSRTRGMTRLEFYMGILIITLAIPLVFVAVYNLIGNREWWRIILPLPLILFCIVELLLDYILQIQFRDTPLLWPYIIPLYLGQLGMIGYSFLIRRIYGFITLGTYFMTLFASWYSFSQASHSEI